MKVVGGLYSEMSVFQRNITIFFVLFGIGDFLSLLPFPDSIKATVIIMPPAYVSLFVGLVFPVTSVLFGILYYLKPQIGSVGLALVSGGYAVLFGAAIPNLTYWEYWSEQVAPPIRWYEMEVILSFLLFIILTVVLIWQSAAPRKASL